MAFFLFHTQVDAKNIIFTPYGKNYFSFEWFEDNFNNGWVIFDSHYLEAKGDPSGFYTFAIEMIGDVRDYEEAVFFSQYVTFDDHQQISYDSTRIESKFLTFLGTNIGTPQESNWLIFKLQVPKTGKFYFSKIEFQSRNGNELNDYSKKIMLYEGDQPFLPENYESYLNCDTTGPILSGGQKVVLTNINQPITLENLRKSIHAFDETDGDVSQSITIIKDEYSQNRFLVGTHEIQFQAQDSSNNLSILTIFVKVVDIDNPVISGPLELISPLSSPKSINDLSSYYQVSDNYSQNLTFSVIEDQFTNNSSTLGTYFITLSAVDESNNSCTFTLQMKVVDDIPPAILGPKSIRKSNSALLSIQEVKNQLSAQDNLDGDLTSTILLITNEYEGNETVVGSYSLVFEVKDSSLNSATLEITIVVYDDTLPTWTIDQIVLTVDRAHLLTKEEIIRLLIASHQIDETNNELIEFKAGNYFENASTSGEYFVTISLIDCESEKEINLTILVQDSSQKNPSTLSLWNHITNFFLSIGNFFSSTFSFVSLQINAFFNWLF